MLLTFYAMCECICTLIFIYLSSTERKAQQLYMYFMYTYIDDEEKHIKGTKDDKANDKARV